MNKDTRLWQILSGSREGKSTTGTSPEHKEHIVVQTKMHATMYDKLAVHSHIAIFFRIAIFDCTRHYRCGILWQG